MIKPTTTLNYLATLMGATLLTAGGLLGGDAKSLVIDDKNPICLEDFGFCRIFDYSTLYKNENNHLIQKVALTGRYHGQHHATTLDFDNFGRVGASFWEHRRFRLGTKIQFLNDFSFYNEWNIPHDDYLTRRAFFTDIDVMGIKWAPSKDFYVDVGKHKAKITREWSTSSKNILTFERAHITNEVISSAGKPWGVTVGFKALGLKHELGAWLTGTDFRSPLTNQGSETGPEFAHFDSRGALSYRGEHGLTDHTDLHFDYLFTNNSDGTVRSRGNADELEASPYNHIFALGTDSVWDIDACRQWGLFTDVIYAVDRERAGGNGLLNDTLNAGEDVFGFVFLPHYDLTERLQLVGRYAYASESRFHRPQRAPFDEDVDGFSAFANAGRPNLEDVNTFYIGLNYRLCGDKLKLMGGYEYLSADLESSGAINNGGVTGDTWMLGIRTYW